MRPLAAEALHCAAAETAVEQQDFAPSRTFLQLIGHERGFEGGLLYPFDLGVRGDVVQLTVLTFVSPVAAQIEHDQFVRLAFHQKPFNGLLDRRLRRVLDPNARLVPSDRRHLQHLAQVVNVCAHGGQSGESYVLIGSGAHE